MSLSVSVPLFKMTRVSICCSDRAETYWERAHRCVTARSHVHEAVRSGVRPGGCLVGSIPAGAAHLAMRSSTHCAFVQIIPCTQDAPRACSARICVRGLSMQCATIASTSRAGDLSECSSTREGELVWTPTNVRGQTSAQQAGKEGGGARVSLPALESVGRRQHNATCPDRAETHRGCAL